MRSIILSSLFVALIVVTTMFVKIPLALFGYVHLGDAFIMLACYMLKPKYSVLVGGIGSAIADLLLGYAYYAPVTFAVKVLVALTFALLVYKKATLFSQIIAVVICSAIIAGGYLIFEVCLYGFSVSIVNVPFNLLQGVACGVVAIVLIRIFRRIPQFVNFRNRL